MRSRQLARLPPGTSRALSCPGEARPWKLYLAILIVVAFVAAWLLGKFDTYLPDEIKADRLLHRGAWAGMHAPSGSGSATPAAPAKSAGAP